MIPAPQSTGPGRTEKACQGAPEIGKRRAFLKLAPLGSLTAVVPGAMALRGVFAHNVTNWPDTALLPYVSGATRRHSVGSQSGGAIERTASPAAQLNTSVTGVVLDPHGRTARLTTVHDNPRFDDAQIRRMSAAVLYL